ncbi:MAG: ROK family protein [Acutalibacteraceae bacterium]
MLEQEALKSIRNKNLSDILQVLRNKGACSLSELTENTDGGLTTVKKCVFQAMDLGMVLEGDVADSTGGRKAKQYLINEKYQYILFIIVDNNDLIVKLYNFKFECVEEYIRSFAMNDFFKSVCASIDDSLEKYPVGTVCLSLPCVVKDGTVIDWYYNQRLNNFNIKSEIEKKYRLNVIVQNDMKLSVLGESVQIGSSIKNIATVQFGHNGIGMAGIVNGHLLEGSRGFAGEVGYINDISKNIMSVSYPAKIVRNAIIFINPEVIVFYKSDRQNSFSKIIDAATRGLPVYAVPEFVISDNYIADIVSGSIALINKYGFFKKAEV